MSVRAFVERAAAELGIGIAWQGTGLEETGRVASLDAAKLAALAGEDFSPRLTQGDVIVRVDPRYFRPTEVETLLGDPANAAAKLGWAPKTSVEDLIAEMTRADFALARRDGVCRDAGFHSFSHHE
jgi:GDPmannose 4,6-dehydratase